MGILPLLVNHHRDDDGRPYELFLNGNGNALLRADGANAEKPDAASLG